MKKRTLSPSRKLTLALMPFAFIAAIALSAPREVLRGADLVSSARSDPTSNYAKYCARCHGADGRSQTAKGKQTGATDLTKSRIGNPAGMKVIAHGKELMPGFKDNLSSDEISGLMSYVRGFRR